MTTPIAPNMRKPLGRALSRNDLELDRLSIVTTADVLAAIDLFHRTAPREFRGLIDAKLERQKEVRIAGKDAG